MLRHLLQTVLVAIAVAFSRLNFPAESVSGAWSSKFPTPPGANGIVYAMTSYRSNLIVGGEFTKIAGLQARGLAKFDGQNWSEFAAIESTNDFKIYSMLSDATNLYVAGHFDHVAGIPAGNIAKWTGDRWESLGGGVAGGGFWASTPWINTLRLQSTNLYAGGSFIYAGSTQAFNIARWDGSQWHALSQGLYLPGDSSDPSVLPYGRVEAITGDGTNIFAGGWFTRAGGNYMTNLAMWNGSAWQSIGTPSEGATRFLWEGEALSGFVHAMEWYDNSLYLAGDFTKIAGLSITNFARWRNNAWDSPISVDDDPSNALRSYRSLPRPLKLNDDLYLSGNFSRATTNSTSFAAMNLLKLHNGVWAPIDTEVAEGQWIIGVQNFSDDLYVGGDFGHVGNRSAANIAKLGPTGWQAIAAGKGNSFHGGVYSIAADETNLFAIGSLTIPGQTNPRSIARWNGSSWTTLPNPSPVSEPLRLAVLNGTLYANGFFDISGKRDTDLIAWDGQSWRTIPTPIEKPSSDLLVIGTNLFASFFATNDVGNWTNVTKWWDGSDWHVIPWATVPAGYSERLGTDGTNLYISRITFPGSAVCAVALWNGSDLFEFPHLTIGSIEGLGGVGTNVWISGYSYAAGVSAYPTYRWDGAVWKEVPLNDSHISKIVNLGNKIVVGGFFKSIDTIAANSLAMFDGSTWHSFDRGVFLRDQIGGLQDIVVAGNRVIVAGQFDQAGPNSSGNIAVWHIATDVQLTIQPAALNQLRLTGGAGDHIQIEGADSLEGWTRLTDFTFPADTVTLTDPRPPTTMTNRFYRARILEP